MTEEYKPVPEDIKRYRAIALAQEYLKEKDQGGLEKAISTFLAKGLGVKQGHDADDLATSLKRVTPDFIENFYSKYQKAFQGSTLKQLRELYDSQFKEYFTEEDLAKADEVFDSDETYGDFIKNYQAIAEKATSQTSNFSDEEKKKAQKQLQILNKIALPMEEFEKLEINKMRAPIGKDILKEKIKDAYNPKEEKKQEE